MKNRWLVAPLLCVAVALAVVMTFSVINRQAIRAEQESLLAASQQYPQFTMAQRRAVLRENLAERHPHWRDLTFSQMVRRMQLFLASSTGTNGAPLANFTGNLTGIDTPAGDPFGMFRQPNCSLTLDWGTYVANLPSVTYTLTGTTPSYDQVLHNAAGLTTNGGNWPAGCGDPVIGIPARKAVYLGTTSSNEIVGANVGFDATLQAQVIFTIAGPVASSQTTIGVIQIAGQSPLGVVAANLTGATGGVSDVVAVSETSGTTGTGAIEVIPVDATGTFGAPVSYSLPGQQGLSVVVDDFNGDGKPDIVATSSTFVTGGATTYYLTYMQGQGNGSFANPQNVTLTPPTGRTGQQYYGLISASLRGNSKKDIVTSAGVVLFGNGDGTFTQAATAAFPSEGGTSEFGPNVVAGDFNKDGKLDLAVDDGASIEVFLGNGLGAFTANGGYATVNNVGYLSGTDLDGDGNIDLYSGIMRAGAFGGDQFEINQAYALMGNGDGTFRGAPEMPFVYTGTNLMDLNGDHVPDGVGLNATLNSSNVSMTSYLGASNGSFTPRQTFQISPVTISGNPYQFQGLDSFGLGDVTGSGRADLLYLPGSFIGPGGAPGYFIATGNGDGTFGTPTFVTAPTFAPSGDTDQTENLTDMFVADVNGDGKADLIYSYSAQDSQTGNYVQGVAVQLSSGDGTFAAPKGIQTYSGATAPPHGLPPVVVQVGHTRAGGALDLFAETFTNTNGTITWQLDLYLGNGDGTFAAATMPKVADGIQLPSFGSAVGQVALADMNGDGKPDLITLGTSSASQGELAISLGNGDGTFQNPTILDFGAGSTLGYGLTAADFDGDGKMDVSVTGFDPPVDAGIFLGNGDGTVQSFSPSSGLVEPTEGIDLVIYGAATTADFNGDGKPDLVSGSAVLINQGAASTLTPTTTVVTASPGTTVTQGTNVTFTATVSASSTPAGNVTFSDGSTALVTVTLDGTGKATYSTSSLAVGVHSITASYTANATFAGSTSPAVAITVSPQMLPATASTLAASATTILSGASVTFTDTVVVSSGTGTPTGTVVFMSGTTNLGSAALNSSGVASFPTTGLPIGVDSVTAVYGGDTNFAGSTSNAVAVTVNGFTIGANPTSATVTAGSSTTTTISVTPGSAFSSAVSFACTGLPTGGTCSFAPPTVMPSGTTAATTVLTIGTTTASGALTMPWRPGSRSGGAATLAVLAAGAMWIFGRRKHVPWMRMMPLIIVLLLIAGVTVGCGGGSGNSGGGGGGGSQPKTYTVSITGTSGSQNQTTTFTLTVN
jgi:hypothetical protein